MLTSPPKGMRAAFLRMTGQYATFIAKCKAEAKAAEQHNRAEQQALINHHLVERRALDRDLGLTKSFVRATQTDPGQGLVIQDAPTDLTKDRLLASPALILGEISKTKASFTRTDVLRELAAYIDDPSALANSADLALASSEAVRLHTDGAKRYTTRDYQSAEQALFNRAKSLAASKGTRISSANIVAAKRLCCTNQVIVRLPLSPDGLILRAP